MNAGLFDPPISDEMISDIGRICAVMGGLELLNDRDELQRYGCNKDEND